MYAEVVFPIPYDRKFHYSVPDELKDTLRPGHRVCVPFGKRNTIGYVVNLTEHSDVPETKSIQYIYDSKFLIYPELLDLGRWISRYYACTLGEALDAILPVSLRTPKREVKKNVNVDTTIVGVENIKDVPVLPELQLTNEQVQAVEQITPLLGKTNKGVTFLIHGVTSSGKTEIYFRCISTCLANNLTTIYLLPEISLTPQFIHLTQTRFGKDLVAVWHSKITGTERYRTYLRIFNGEAKIVLGARSAVFAPVRNLGLIVVDEEHEFTYKQDQKPFYHTREVATKRAEISPAVVVLGSATPSLESYYHTKQGIYRLIELRERIAKREHAPVQIIDLRSSRGDSTSSSPSGSSESGEKKVIPVEKVYSYVFSPALVTGIRICLDKKEQVILFINRRGFSTVILCRNCGYTAKCDRCGVSMVYHREGDILRCHYCRKVEKVPLTCPACRSVRIRFGGVGTQKVESEVKKLFPYARVQRVDLDTAAKKGAYEQIYHKFKNHELDILIGTQIIAKGFDFPKVTLVGLVSADTSLYLPDFRATERTFQLVTQVAGRAGRSLPDSKVVLQTFQPDHYVFQTAKEYNYHKFYQIECNYRSTLEYPPVTDLVRILFRGMEEEKVRTIAAEFVPQIENTIRLLGLSTRVKVLGPTGSYFLHIRGKYRYYLLLKGKSADLSKVVEMINVEPRKKGVQITYDVDPIEMV